MPLKRLFRPVSAALTLGIALAACNTFHRTGPESATPVPVPRLVTVVIEYRQPPVCASLGSSCDGPVVFYGSWMRPGNEFALTPQPATFVWKGTAINVPVNFPPFDQPYFVRIFDPYLRDTSTLGNTAERLRVGGQFMLYIQEGGTPLEAALVYIDDNGHGRTPF